MGKTARRIVMLLAACALAAPAAATAQEPPSTGGTTAPGSEPALTATPHVLVGNVARFSGAFSARDAGRTVTIERFDAQSGAWTAVATARVLQDGSYLARWRADVTGHHRTRATLQRARDANEDGGAALLAAAQPDEASMTVYRPAVASWYGPGLYGRTTACGVRMTRTLLGVAHRRLPCGTEVALTYGGRSISVPVVDRGPFRPGRRWDLTAATAKALGFTFTDRIGAVRIG
jgi:rare lipoprotein A